MGIIYMNEHWVQKQHQKSTSSGIAQKETLPNTFPGSNQPSLLSGTQKLQAHTQIYT